MKYMDYIRLHVQENDGIRLGQRFCNDFLKYSWPELFYEEDNGKASNMIWEWLKNHQYFECLPERVQWTEDSKDAMG